MPAHRCCSECWCGLVRGDPEPDAPFALEPGSGRGCARPDWAEGAESSPWKGWHVLRVGPGVRRWAGRWGDLTERAAKIGSRAFDRAAWPTTQYLSEENGTVLTTVSGWPALAMKHERWAVESEIDGNHIIEVGVVRSGLAVGKRAVPLNPIWTGFVINSLFYAALAFIPFIGESSARLRSVIVEAAALVRSNRRASPLVGPCAIRHRARDDPQCPCGVGVRGVVADQSGHGSDRGMAGRCGSTVLGTGARMESLDGVCGAWLRRAVVVWELG